ncbi:MAG: AMP-binding protein, partial [bacterium]|nr:AMP-binding protein [bacterium]
KEFQGELPVLILPTDYPRPAIQSFEGGTLDFQLDKKETTQLKNLALEEGVTLYMALLGLFNIFLSKISTMEDIIIGTPTAGRRHPDLEHVMGMFVNTLVMRNYPRREQSFLKFLHAVKERTLEAFENQDYPFEDLVENVEVNRDAGRNPLFDVLFTLQIQTLAGEPAIQLEDEFPPQDKPAKRNTDAKQDETQDEYLERAGTSKFDLTLHAFDTGEELFFTFEYCGRLFKAETIRRFIAYFNKTVTDLLADPHKKPAELEIISEAEKQRILVEFNDTAAGYPADKTIHELFAEQVRKNPDATAVTGPCGISENPEEGLLSYKELDEHSSRLARLLIEKGVKIGDIVALAMERSVEMIVAMPAVLKAGGAYLPIDIEAPYERSRYMLEDSGAVLLLTTRSFSSQIIPGNTEDHKKIIHLDEIDLNSQGSGSSGQAVKTTANPSDLAYIIYTSGTSGRPKGVLIEHRNVVRLFFNDKFPFQFNRHDTWTMFHSHCFDFSVWEIYGALLFGGKLIIIPKMTARDPKEFARVLQKE